MPRPTSVMEMFYLYDERRFISPEECTIYQLLADIDREMQTRTIDAQVDFMMDLAAVQMALPEGDHNKSFIQNYIMNYFMPLDANGDLKKDEFESRLAKLADRKIERIYIPQGEFSLSQKGRHSDKWIAQQLSHTEAGLMELGLDNALSHISHLDEKVKEAYDGSDFENVFQKLSEENDRKKLDSMSEEEEKREKAKEGLCYKHTINSREYSEEEKTAQKVLEEKEKANSALLDYEKNKSHRERNKTTVALAYYGLARDANLSFVSDPGLYDILQNEFEEQKKNIVKEKLNPSRHQDRIMDKLAVLMEETSEVIFDDKINGYWIFDSKEFNTIKDDIKLLQRDLKKGNSLHNLKEINASLETFSKHCQDYLDKNQGKRLHERGNARKSIVETLKKCLDEQRQELKKHFGDKLKNLDNEWLDVTKTETEEGIKIKMSYADLEGNKKNLKNKLPKNPEPAKGKVKGGPEK